MRTLDRITWPVTTERLLLRPGTPDDLAPLQAIRADPEVAQWMPDRPESYVDWVLGAGRRDMLATTVVISLDGSVVGHLYLHVEDAWAQAEVREQGAGQQAEIGWCLAPSAQGHGYATEAVKALLRVCFEQLGVRRVTAVAFADNAASQAVMRRVGMRLEGVFRQESLHRDLGWLDSVQWAILKDEWVVQQRPGGA